MLIEYTPQKGYQFRQYVNRAAIADVLGREKLVPYDIRMLRQLHDLRLVEEAKHPLPRKCYGDIWLGAGAEFVYTIPSDILYCLLYHDPKERARLLVLKPRGISTGRAGTPITSPKLDRRLDMPRAGQKRSLLARIRDWIDF